MNADLTHEQLDLLKDHRAFRAVPPGADPAEVLALQAADLVDEYGRLTSLGATVLARWEDAHDVPFAHVGFDVPEQSRDEQESRRFMSGLLIGLLIGAAAWLILIGAVALVMSS